MSLYIREGRLDSPLSGTPKNYQYPRMWRKTSAIANHRQNINTRSCHDGWWRGLSPTITTTGRPLSGFWHWPSSP